MLELYVYSRLLIVSSVSDLSLYEDVLGERLDVWLIILFPSQVWLPNVNSVSEEL